MGENDKKVWLASFQKSYFCVTMFLLIWSVCKQSLTSVCGIDRAQIRTALPEEENPVFGTTFLYARHLKSCIRFLCNINLLLSLVRYVINKGYIRISRKISQLAADLVYIS